jgi:hypothetical protein
LPTHFLQEPRPINSSISPSSSAIEVHMQAGSSVNIAQNVSTLKHDTPGDVLDDFSPGWHFSFSAPTPRPHLSSGKWLGLSYKKIM